MLLGKQAFATAKLETARIQYRGHFASPTSHGGDLVNVVVGREASEWNIQGLPVDLGRILEHVRKVNVRVAENKFIRKAWAENMRQARRNRVGFVLSQNRCGVRHLGGISPPQSNRELLRLFLQVVANV